MLAFSRVGVGKRGKGTCLVGFFPRFLLCGADDGSRTRCLRLGRVALSAELRRIKQGTRPTFVGCVALFECRRAGPQGAACVLVR